MDIDRRSFLLVALAGAAYADTAEPWGGPVLDVHLHSRPDPQSDMAHLEGSGVTHAVLLTRVSNDEQTKSAIKKYPGHFTKFSSTDVTKPGAVDLLRKEAEGGAIGFGELKDHTALDSPEMKAVYALAAEFKIPVLMHFQEIGGDGGFNTGFTRFPAVLKANPHTVFIGHGDFFWANISADEPTGVTYPTGKVKRGGLTDRMLSEYPNLYGDLSANSGRNSLARDPDFAGRFLQRHSTKLLFGSDCPCLDGRGKGQVSQAPLIKDRCVARETLTALKGLTSEQLFRSITWDNGKRLLRLPF